MPEASGLTAAVSSPATNLPIFFKSRVLSGHTGVAELLNRWLFERVRAMLHQADLLKTL